MEKEVNAGYTITDRLAVGNSEFVIAQRDEAPTPFVTWKCRAGEKDYYWGHYLNDRLRAVEDLCKRALDEVEYLRSLEHQKDDGQKVRQTEKKKHGPER
jgi:hypothetical protein